MSHFDNLVAEFERLSMEVADKKGNERTKLRREQKRVESMIEDLADTGLNYSDIYADCRDIGHQWDEVFSEWEGEELTRLHRCDRCGAERLDVYSRTGRVVKRAYDYSDGYTIDGDQEELRVAVDSKNRKRFWRTVNIQRVIKSS